MPDLAALEDEVKKARGELRFAIARDGGRAGIRFTERYVNALIAAVVALERARHPMQVAADSGTRRALSSPLDALVAATLLREAAAQVADAVLPEVVEP